MSRRFTVQLTTANAPNELNAGETDVSSLTYSAVDWLEPLFMSDVANGEIGELRLLASKHPEDAISGGAIRGRFVRVLDTSNSNLIVFSGVVVKQHIIFDQQAERYELVAYQNGEFLLSRINLHGQLRLSYTKEQAYFETGLSEETTPAEDADLVRIDSPLIFNPDGEPNMHPRDFHWAIDSSMAATSANKFHIFEAPFRKQFNLTGQDLTAVPWTLRDALAYLFNTNKAFWCLNPTSYGDSALTPFFDNHPNPIISNINLEGRDLLEALRELLVPHNYIFRISPHCDPITKKHDITFIYRDAASTVGVLLSPRGTKTGDSDANLIQTAITIDNTATVNNLLGVGDNIRETTLAHTTPPTPASGKPPVMTLVPGWRLADLTWAFSSAGVVNPYDIDFRRDYCNEYLVTQASSSSAGSSAKRGIFGVGRIWLVNQGQAPSYDLEDLTTDFKNFTSSSSSGSGISRTQFNSIDLRRLEPPEIFDRNYQNSLINQTDIVVEMSFDGGGHWRIVERSWYRVLEDGMGIVITNIEQLERLGLKWVNDVTPTGVDYWQALYNTFYANGGTGTSGLQIRILCSAKSDERVKAAIRNDGAAFPLAIEREFENTGYQRQNYNDLITDAVYFTKFPPAKNVRDDTPDFYTLARTQLSMTNRTLVSGQFVVVLSTMFTYTPGLQIPGITNRFDFQFPPTILRVIYDFASEHVILVVDNRLHKTVLKSAPVEQGTDSRGHHFGIGSLDPVRGGHLVPYLPGDDTSMREYFRTGGGR